jgi:hypothetical protein
VPRYSPLPSVSIDPRNEAQLVQEASQRVYEASNQTLNDFSSGNPLAALLEGQAFAQGEFLFWANQLPDSILIEWLGPFMGAMRRLGTPATAQLIATIPSSTQVVTVPAGATFTTNANLSGGETYTFVSTELVEVPPGVTEFAITVTSQFVGSIYNVPANSITTTSAINVNSLFVTNPRPAVGGSDVETFQEVQERFFTLIRRKNPVSAQDWQDFFVDFFGTGTLTSVQPNRPSQQPYNYLTDYLLPNGKVSFFVLGPGGVELTPTQLQRGQNAINFFTPMEFSGHLYPFTLSQVQFDLTLTVEANGAFGVNLKNSSLNFRDRLFEIIKPGNIFPADINPTVSDVDSAFYSTFDAATQYSDPHIEVSAAYSTPPGLETSAATYTQVYEFTPKEYLLNENDLVVTTVPNTVYYSVESSFTPYSGAKLDQPIYGNLQLQQIKYLTPGVYSQGQVAYWDPASGGDGFLHVILENLTIGAEPEIPTLLTLGKISKAMVYSPWVTGNTYQAVTSGGLYSPQIITYDYAGDEFIPSSPIALDSRPGAFVWVVAQNFTLQPSTNDLTGAQTDFKLSSFPVTPQELIPGTSYTAGTWVYTPQVGSGPNAVADPFYNYVDIRQGVVNKYAYVISNFTYNPNSQSETVSVYFDTLVEQGIIKEIVVQNGDSGLPIYEYKPRFPAGTYLEYRTDNISSPEFYIATTFFTPSSTDSQVLVNQGVIVPLYLNAAQRTEFITYLSTPSSKTPTRMFRFWKGDRTFFRQGTTLLSYTATTNVTPLFNFNIYLENGIFAPTAQYNSSQFVADQYIPYFNPAYAQYAEDTIVSEDGKNLYRVMKAFTPNLTVTNWTNTTVVNTARVEEYEGNLLRYVNKYTCEQDILAQLGRDISAIKLGIAQITLVPQNKGRFTNDNEQYTYVWENTQTIEETPELSWYTGTTYGYRPPQYGEGTMRL